MLTVITLSVPVKSTTVLSCVKTNGEKNIVNTLKPSTVPVHLKNLKKCTVKENGIVKISTISLWTLWTNSIPMVMELSILMITLMKIT